jgi:signal transduction histidine kinase
MIDGFFSRRLSGKLLLMTIGFVMLAELVLFLPSATLFRQTYLTERAQQAGHLALALDGVPDYEGSAMLSQKFMEDTDVIMVAIKREGMTQLLLGMPPSDPDATFEAVDLRDARRLPLFRYAVKDFFSDGEGYYRVISDPIMDDQGLIEIVLSKASVKTALRDFFERIFWLSLAIAVITGTLIYLALAAMIVRPIQKLASGLADFREDPDKRRGNLKPSARRDEIGQLEREFFDMKQGVRASFRQRERLASLGMAVAKINHDLRNVLTSAQLVSDRIAMDKDERIAGMGERLVRAVDRGVRLCTDVLNYSNAKDEQLEIKEVRIALLIGEIAGDVLGQFGRGPTAINFVNKIPSELSVRVDADHTYRIIHNLFRNAGQALQSMNAVDAKRQITVSSEVDEGQVKLRITDTGPGLPKRAIDNLFKAFASSSGHGSTGLGLTISKDLATDQGGDLELGYTGETGTEFVLTLPKG